MWARSTSRYGYGYVEGNPTSWTDPSGEILLRYSDMNLCQQFTTPLSAIG
ncbi:MAG: hypothetical protein DYG88_12420 [Chloroflexi bacterium CFX4]|nr:hypothetical protein [Chloroflexi bacterium CFX4]